MTQPLHPTRRSAADCLDDTAAAAKSGAALRLRAHGKDYRPVSAAQRRHHFNVSRNRRQFTAPTQISPIARSWSPH
jgi:hypothetical protein